MIRRVQARTQQTRERVLRCAGRRWRLDRSQRRGFCQEVAVLILLLACACGGDNSQHEQARALLERISALDLNATPAERKRRLDRLHALPLTEERLVRVRDLCLEAHTGLLAAELEQTVARKRLDAAQSGAPNPDRKELEAIAAQVAHAATTLREAQAVLPECEQSMRGLAQPKR
jgi:hypothetical protein